MHSSRKSCKFGLTWGWTNVDGISILEWTELLTNNLCCRIQKRPLLLLEWCACKCLWHYLHAQQWMWATCRCVMFSRGLCSEFGDDGVVIASSESLAPRITRSGRAAVAVWSVCPCTVWTSCSVRGRSCLLRSSEPDATLLNVDSRKSSDDWVRCSHFTQTHAQFYTAWAHVTDPSDVDDALHLLLDKIQTAYIVPVE